MIFRNKEELIHFSNQGNMVEYVFFWGHKKPKSGVSKTCFSQWYDSPFENNGVIYQTAEHYMMAEKAKLFGDNGSAKRIVAAGNPGEAKKLGREVKGFEENRWFQHRFEIVVKGNLAKFSQHADLLGFLLNTGNRVLVEASPADKVWGIGLASHHPSVKNPNLWKGLNLLGFALMEVRDFLSR